MSADLLKRQSVGGLVTYTKNVKFDPYPNHIPTVISDCVYGEDEHLCEFEVGRVSLISIQNTNYKWKNDTLVYIRIIDFVHQRKPTLRELKR